MSNEAQQFLEAFNALPPETRHEVAVVILRQTAPGVEHEAVEQDELRRQVQEGIKSPGVPAGEAIDHLRSVARVLAEGRS